MQSGKRQPHTDLRCSKILQERIAGSNSLKKLMLNMGVMYAKVYPRVQPLFFYRASVDQCVIDKNEHRLFQKPGQLERLFKSVTEVRKQRGHRMDGKDSDSRDSNWFAMIQPRIKRETLHRDEWLLKKSQKLRLLEVSLDASHFSCCLEIHPSWWTAMFMYWKTRRAPTGQ